VTKIGGLGKLSEGFLGSVDQIEEPILILLLPVQLRHGHGDGGQVGVVNQDEECLGGVELEAAADDLDELADGDVVGDQELGLVQHRQLLLSAEPLDDAGHLAGVLRPDLLHVLHTQRVAAALLERLLSVHPCSSGGCSPDTGLGGLVALLWV